MTYTLSACRPETARPYGQSVDNTLDNFIPQLLLPGKFVIDITITHEKTLRKLFHKKFRKINVLPIIGRNLTLWFFRLEGFLAWIECFR
jgi:hypothetical protein